MREAGSQDGRGHVALEFSKRGFSVLPVGPNKRPWTEHGVYSASTDPHIFSRWEGAACALATGGKVEVLDADENPLHVKGLMASPL